MTTTQHDFTIVRTYPYSPQQVFAAWAEPEKRRLWFGNSPGLTVIANEMDIREGGRDHAESRHERGVTTTFDSEYHRIIPGEQVVYSYTMTLDGEPLSATLACVTFEAADGGTLLTLTEHGVYYGPMEHAELREQGTRQLLGTMGDVLNSLHQ